MTTMYESGSFTMFTRRDMLRSAGAGFGYLALAGLAANAAAAPAQGPKPFQLPARAKRAIFLFMHGGPSQVDTFDYKPRLQQDDGKDATFALSKGASGSATNKLLASPWKFAKHGESGIWV